MAHDESAERRVVAFDVPAQQRRVVDVVDIGREVQDPASREPLGCGEPSAAAAR